MAKNSITDYSKTAASNTDIQSVDIDEGCLPSGINNAIRELMADLAEMNDGTVTLTSPSFAAATITGDLTVDTSTLKVDSTNNMVGIGTTSPSTNLTVSSGASSAAVHSYTKLEIESSSHGALQLSGSTGAEQWIWFADDSSSTPVGGITYYHGGPYMAFRVEGSERMRIDSSGNVGIGTTDPKFHLQTDNGGLDSRGSGAGIAIRNNIYYSSGDKYLTASGAASTQYFDGSGNIIFYNTGTASSGAGNAVSLSERMRIDSSGNVGIGTASPSAPLHVVGNSYVQSGTFYTDAISAYSGSSISINAGSSHLAATVNGSERMRINSSGNVGIGTTSPSGKLHVESNDASQLSLTRTGVGTFGLGVVAGDALIFLDGASERMRIDSSGNVLVGKTSDAFGTAGCELRPEGSLRITRSNSTAGFFNRLSSDGVVVNFYKDSSSVGSISVTTTSTAYNTSSDYRLKENVADLTGAITRVKSLQPKRFNFIADDSVMVDGFLAHEAATVVPEAVTGEKDAVDEDGNPEYQGIDQAKLVPLLTAALQEAITKIEDLEARVATLEGN